MSRSFVGWKGWCIRASLAASPTFPCPISLIDGFMLGEFQPQTGLVNPEFASETFEIPNVPTYVIQADATRLVLGRRQRNINPTDSASRARVLALTRKDFVKKI